MKKIAWFVPVLIATPMALAVACGGPAEMDGTGGTDGGTGGNDPTGGSSNDGTGGSSDGTGGSSDGSGGSTGGSDVGGMGGMGGAMGGIGGMGGGDGDPLLIACETMCAAAVAGDASECDEDACVYGCAYSYAAYYAGYGCEEEYLAFKECSATAESDEFFCDAGTVGVTICQDEKNAVTDCL